MRFQAAPLFRYTILFSRAVGCDAGERFSFGSSIMISINIYLIALSERLPVSRDGIPVLGMSFTLQHGLFLIYIMFSK